MPLPLPDRLSDGTELLSRSLWPLLRDSRFKTFTLVAFFFRAFSLFLESCLCPPFPPFCPGPQAWIRLFNNEYEDSSEDGMADGRR